MLGISIGITAVICVVAIGKVCQARVEQHLNNLGERTREIGVRVAVGATEEAIQLQFLGESIMLGLVGGSAGVLLGVLGSYLVGQISILGF